MVLDYPDIIKGFTAMEPLDDLAERRTKKRRARREKKTKKKREEKFAEKHAIPLVEDKIIK